MVGPESRGRKSDVNRQSSVNFVVAPNALQKDSRSSGIFDELENDT
jgi:hypothetical protein